MTLIQSIVDNEGFSPVAYPDPLTKGAPYTFGHGLTSITVEESLFIVQNRIDTIRSNLNSKIVFFNHLFSDAQDVLIEMAYQMGVDGLLGFKGTLTLLSKGDYIAASKEMLNSKWARQTPKRAERLSRKLALSISKQG